MREKTPRELISAYFDGELPPAEALEAERLLEHDADARQFLEELESLRDCLGDLPSAHLPPDLPDRVLQEAERRMLKAPVTDARAAQRHERHDGRGMWLRVGLALTVAASLILTFVLSNRHDPADRTPVAARTTESSTPPESGAVPPADHWGKDSVARLETDGAAPAEGVGLERRFKQKAGFGRFAEQAERESGYFAKMPAEPATKAGALPQQQLAMPRPADAPAELAAELTNSYVLDVPSDVAQNRVLAQFEQVLNEQQIALERNGSLAEPAVSDTAADESDRAADKAGQFETADKRQAALSQNADRVYVIEATPEQLSNTIDGLNRLAGESKTPVRLRRLGTADNGSGASLYSTAGDMKLNSAYGGSQGVIDLQRVTSNSGAPGMAGRAEGVESQSASQRGGAAGALGARPEPTGEKETLRKSTQNDLAETAPPSSASTVREMREQKKVTQEAGGADSLAVQKQLPAPPANPAMASNEQQQRAIFIFRVVPIPTATTPTPAAAAPVNPAPAAEPAQPNKR